MEEKNHEDNNSIENDKIKKISPNKKLLYLSDSYLSDLECLREMFSSVLPMLQDQDKERNTTVEKIVKKIGQEIKIKENEKNNTHEEKNNNNDSNEKEISLNISSSDLDILFANIKKMNRAVQLFKQQLTVSLISRFDEFLGSLLKIAYISHV
ncbi:MAG: hypothetical protein K8R74_09205 [Bacteroidales bacterium]|nr:hypothetical protein [Bacteroidales bacterium]